MGFGNQRPSRDNGNGGKRDMRGKLWPNDKRRGERDPHFTGLCTIDGRDYRVSAWNSDRDETVSLSFKEKTEDRRQGYERSKENYRYDDPPTAPNRAEGYSDDRRGRPRGDEPPGWEPDQGR